MARNRNRRHSRGSGYIFFIVIAAIVFMNIWPLLLGLLTLTAFVLIALHIATVDQSGVSAVTRFAYQSGFMELVEQWRNPPRASTREPRDYTKSHAPSAVVEEDRRKPASLFKSAIPEQAKAHAAAEAALKRAGHNPHDVAIPLDDIGLLVYETGEKEPRIYRNNDVPKVANHIRPFAVLHHSGGTLQKTVRFNILDEAGKLRYTNRSRYTLKSGQNFITPPTWLPVDNQQPNGRWSLGISIDDRGVLANHEFDWIQMGGEARAQFTGDGEIDELTFKLMDDSSAAEPMSLDELLGDQVVEESQIRAHAHR
ncbi:MAG: hypothetical protein ABI947_13515 [Chloroflexota bacterium]